MTELTYADLFSRAVRESQPDSDPVLTYGDGQTPDPTQDIDSILLSCRRAITWAAGQPLRYGQIVRPLTANGLEYVVVVPGVSGASEPDWNTARSRWGNTGGSRVQDNTAVLEQFGVDGGEYDVDEALGRVLQLKADRCGDRIDYSADGVSFKETQTRDYWQKRAARYITNGSAMIA